MSNWFKYSNNTPEWIKSIQIGMIIILLVLISWIAIPLFFFLVCYCIGLFVLMLTFNFEISSVGDTFTIGVFTIIAISVLIIGLNKIRKLK